MLATMQSSAAFIDSHDNSNSVDFNSNSLKRVETVFNSVELRWRRKVYGLKRQSLKYAKQKVYIRSLKIE